MTEERPASSVETVSAANYSASPRRSAIHRGGAALGRILEMVVAVIAGAVVTGLAILTVVATAVFRTSPEASGTKAAGSGAAALDAGAGTGTLATSPAGKLIERQEVFVGWSQLWIIPAIALAFGLYVAVASLVKRLPESRRMAVFLVAVFLLQLIWILGANMLQFRYPDTTMVSRGATALLRGDIGQFAPDYCSPPSGTAAYQHCMDTSPTARGGLFTYYSWYPFQSGSVLWFTVIFALFGAGNVIAFQTMNAVAMTGAAAALCFLGKRVGLNGGGTALLQLLIVFSSPLWMFAIFVYGNVVGLALVLAAFCCAVAAVDGSHRNDFHHTSSRHGEEIRVRPRKRALLLVAAYVLMALAIVVKSTSSLFLIAMTAVILLDALRRSRVVQAAVALLGFVLVWLSQSLPVRLLEMVTHQNFGKGLPTLAWIQLGLEEARPGMPGWWSNAALQAFRDAKGDYGAQSGVAKRAVADRLHEFASNPGAGVSFFVRKLTSEWADPTFQTLFYSSSGKSISNGGILDFALTEPGKSIVMVSADAMQSLIFVGAIAGLIAVVRRLQKDRLKGGETSEVTALLLGVGFLGGFVCYLLWEAKSIYTLPFYVLLFPLAALGLQEGTRWCARRSPFVRLLRPRAITR